MIGLGSRSKKWDPGSFNNYSFNKQAVITQVPLLQANHLLRRNDAPGNVDDW